MSTSDTAPTIAVPLVAGSCRSNAPARDPVGDDRREQFGELGADHEAERLGRLGGGLGDHRVGEAPRCQGPGREQLDRFDQPVGRRVIRSDDRGDRRQLSTARLANDLGDQVVARREVAVHGADRDAGPGRDCSDRGRGQSRLAHDITRRGQDRRPRPFVPFTRRRGPSVHHRQEVNHSSVLAPTTSRPLWSRPSACDAEGGDQSPEPVESATRRSTLRRRVSRLNQTRLSAPVRRSCRGRGVRRGRRSPGRPARAGRRRTRAGGSCPRPARRAARRCWRDGGRDRGR